jgi:HEPN domain-containing protein
MNEVANRWLEQANEDLATAQILLDSGKFGPCAFYCQEEHYMRPRYPDATRVLTSRQSTIETPPKRH